MNDLIILGTDTNVGKTTFALLWLTQFTEQFEYWKPIETGASDSARVLELIPIMTVHPSAKRLQTPVAPPLAARLEGEIIPSAKRLAASRPQARDRRSLLIESFGGPFSPLNEVELQLDLIRELSSPCLLVSSPALGGIGRTLQSLAALRSEDIHPCAVLLLGPGDAYVQEQIARYYSGHVVSFSVPTAWNTCALQECAAMQRNELSTVHAAWSHCQPPHARIAPNVAYLHAEDQRCVWHPYTALVEAEKPLACVSAQDEFLHLADGRRVIDAISSWWTILHGHRYPPLMKALEEAAATIDHVLFAGVTHPYAVELADLLLGTMPWIGGRVFYSDNGSTAVEVALKMAYQFWCHQGQPGRTRFVGFEHGYHGDTFGAMAVSRDPLFFGRFEPLLFQADIVPLQPDMLDQHLQRHPGQIAAVILEPMVQGAGGMRMHTMNVLQQIVAITRRHGILFIADEVMTGGGRTGPLWAHQAAEVVPDLLCAAKTLTGGVLPLAATLVAPQIVMAFMTSDRTRTFFHGHSFTANPLACAVAACNFRLLLSQPRHVAAGMEQFWHRALEPLCAHPRIKEIRIRGSIAALEINVAGGYLAEVGRHLQQQCLIQGVYLRPLGSVLYAMPPLEITNASLEKIASAMIDAVRSL